MIRARWPNEERARRPGRWRWLALLLWLCPTLAAAQPAAPPSTQQGVEVRIAANARTLWLAVVSGSKSRLFSRSAGGRFDLGYPIDGRIAFMATAEREPLVFFDDGQSYRYLTEPGRLKPARNLPADQLPVDVVGNRDVIYAIIPSETARELGVTDAERTETTTQELFDPGDVALSLAVYDGRTWTAAAALPAQAQPAPSARLKPRLCLVDETLLLFTVAGPSGSILCFQRDLAEESWKPCGTLGPARLTGFWALNFENRPMLLTASPGSDGGENVTALRLLGNVARSDATDWRPAELEMSELPAGVLVARYEDAVAFNQHLGLLTIGDNGDAYLRFARLAAKPAEPTLAVADVLAEPAIALRMHGLLQMVTFILLLAVLAGLFVFRRGSMLKIIELPPGCALAFQLQRLCGWLIDFVPFALAAAAMLDVSWSEGIKSLTRWAISPAEENLPEQSVLTWWALTVIGYTVYTLVMELLTHRTVGKVLVRMQVLSESGTRPALWQVLTRNATRLLELSLPTLLWIVAVLVLLSRNHQRMGDIFARTVVIRLTRVQPSAEDRTTTGPPDEGAASTPDQDGGTPSDTEKSDATPPEPPDSADDESPDAR